MIIKKIIKKNDDEKKIKKINEEWIKIWVKGNMNGSFRI